MGRLSVETKKASPKTIAEKLLVVTKRIAEKLVTKLPQNDPHHYSCTQSPRPATVKKVDILIIASCSSRHVHDQSYVIKTEMKLGGGLSWPLAFREGSVLLRCAAREALPHSLCGRHALDGE